MNFNLINPKHYFIELKKFLRYAWKPIYIETTEGTIGQKINGTWTIFVIKTVLTLLLGALVTLIYDPVNKTSARWNEEFSTLTIFFLGVILLPLLEEIAFRLSLKFKPIFLALSLGVIGYYIMTKAVYLTKLSNTDIHFTSRVLTALIIILIAFPVLSIKNVNHKLEGNWRQHFKWIFYFFCFTFAWVHIFNYGITLKHILLLPLITLPKLISAMSYGYIRMHYGFVYSLGVHMAWNSIGVIVSLFPGISSDLII